jgi:hypothetical protein
MKPNDAALALSHIMPPNLSPFSRNIKDAHACRHLAIGVPHTEDLMSSPKERVANCEVPEINVPQLSADRITLGYDQLVKQTSGHSYGPTTSVSIQARSRQR